MSLIRLLYRSDSELTGSPRAVREAAFSIADAARVRNEVDGVSGALMFIGGVFVQSLEGAGPAVETVFERICGDFRHRRLVLLDYSEVRVRTFETGMIAFEGDERARALFPTVTEATTFAHGNRLSANMAIELMHTLLHRRTTRAASTGAVRMVATHVID